MQNSFKYVFVETKPTWIKLPHFFSWSSYRNVTSLSFSSDGTALASSLSDVSNFFDNSIQIVQFWDTSTARPTSAFKNSKIVFFSPTDPDMAAFTAFSSFTESNMEIKMVKRDVPGGNTWSILSSAEFQMLQFTFRADGKTIMVPTILDMYINSTQLTLALFRNIRGMHRVSPPVRLNPTRSLLVTIMESLKLYHTPLTPTSLSCTANSPQPVLYGFLLARGRRIENGLQRVTVVVTSVFGMRVV
jgi:hypothetical protein